MPRIKYMHIYIYIYICIYICIYVYIRIYIYTEYPGRYHVRQSEHVFLHLTSVCV